MYNTLHLITNNQLISYYKLPTIHYLHLPATTLTVVFIYDKNNNIAESFNI